MKAPHNMAQNPTAIARARDLAISTKHGVEISKCLRFKTTASAAAFLKKVIALQAPVPFKTHHSDTGHKAGIAAGRFPQKAAREFLRLIKSVEANAQAKGLDVSHLKITKLVTNKAAIPVSGGRLRVGTKRSHLDIEVKEMPHTTKGKEKEGTKSKAGERRKETAGKKSQPQDNPTASGDQTK